MSARLILAINLQLLFDQLCSELIKPKLKIRLKYVCMPLLITRCPYPRSLSPKTAMNNSCLNFLVHNIFGAQKQIIWQAIEYNYLLFFRYLMNNCIDIIQYTINCRILYMKKIGNLYKISKNEQKKIKNPKQMINPDQNIYINKFNIVLIISMY